MARNLLFSSGVGNESAASRRATSTKEVIMRVAYRTLIFTAAFAATAILRAQDPNPPAEATPIPTTVEQAPAPAAESQAAPEAPAPDAAPAPVVETVPAQMAPLPVAPLPTQASPAAEAPAHPAVKEKTEKKAVTVRKPRPATPDVEVQEKKAPDAATAATAGAAVTDAGQAPPPPSSGVSTEAAVPPVPVAEQSSVQPAVSETPATPATRPGSFWLLIGGLGLGLAGIVTMLTRRNRDDSISIVDHDSTLPKRPTVMLSQRS